jgi:hypothetical protein
MYPKEPKEMFKLAEKSGVQEISGFFPTEG